MKYIILLALVIVILFAKPWELSFAEGRNNYPTNSLLLASVSPVKTNFPLFPIGKVITNGDSELPETERLDRSIQRFMSQWDIRGASFALMKNDSLIYSKGYGFADVENGESMNVHHIFRIASVSKLITAVGILKLQEEGKLRLSDKAFGPDGILNDPIFSDIKDKRSLQITVEDLLRHQAGFSSTYGDPMFYPVDIAEKMNAPVPADLNTITRFLLSRRLRFTPGKGAMYSNAGYGVLSLIIEKISGQKYEEYISAHILHPAGCFDMHLGRNLYENRLANEVKYYEAATEEFVPACDGSKQMVCKYYGGNNIEGLYGAGGWVASASELLRFMASINEVAGITDILKPETINQMTTYKRDSMPIGWMHIMENGEWWRTGTLSGTSVLMKRQADGYSWVFITNTSCWKGSKFPSYINGAITRALQTVPSWPSRDLFKQQLFDQQRLFVSQ